MVSDHRTKARYVARAPIAKIPTFKIQTERKRELQREITTRRRALEPAIVVRGGEITAAETDSRVGLRTANGGMKTLAIAVPPLR